MSILGALAGGLGLFGAAQKAEQSRTINKKLMKALKKDPPKLEIPAAYRQLMANINDQYGQAGDAATGEITRGFGQNFAHVLGQLQMRGLSSSNLTANLSAGNEKRKQEAIANMRAGLLGSQTGMQQNIGLSGLGQVSGERMQQFNARSGLLGSIAPQYLSPSQSGVGQNAIQGLGMLAGFA